MNTNEIERRIKYLGRGAFQIIERDELAWKIEKADREGRSLIVKLGVDPTAPDLHLGHTVPLMKLKHFQDLGYSVDFLIGDFTARIGDPSGRSSARKPMTEEEVLSNAEQYKRQIFKILNPELTNIVYNSHWLGQMKVDDFIRVLGKGTVNEMSKRSGVADRLEKKNPVSVAEFVYPFLQAYDSVEMKADVEIGGEDQYFNFVFTREMQRLYGQEPQVCMTLPLLIGTDGIEKMSKSLNNHIGIEESPSEMYRKVMSIEDNLIIKYFDLLTSVPFEEVSDMESGLLKEEKHPRDLKARLSEEIVSQYHSREEAIKAAGEFDAVYKHHQLPEEIEEMHVKYENGIDLRQLLLDIGMTKSRSNAKHLILQGGVRIDGEEIRDPLCKVSIKDGMVVNVGKIKYRRLRCE